MPVPLPLYAEFIPRFQVVESESESVLLAVLYRVSQDLDKLNFLGPLGIYGWVNSL